MGDSSQALMAAVELVVGAVMGLSLGVFGAGGSIVAVPAFVYLLGFGVKQAVAMSLVVVAVTSLTGALRAWRVGDVRPRPALLLGGVAMVGAYLGARAAHLLGDGTQLTLFALVLLGSALFMLVGPTDARREAAGAGGTSSPPLLGIALAGAVVGVLTGLLGVGGGFLIVPALSLLGLPMSAAVGTSLVVITMNAVAGLAGYVGRIDLPWTAVGTVAAAGIAGVLLGARLARGAPQRMLRRGFAVLLVLVGAWVLFQNMSSTTLPDRPAASAPAGG